MEASEPRAACCTCCTPRFCQQWWALMMKNWHVKKRNCVTTIMEIFVPVLVMLIIVSIRSAVVREDVEPTHFFNTSDSDNRVYQLNPEFIPLEVLASDDYDPLDIIKVYTMKEIAIKLIRRGHIIAISPNIAPFYDPSDPSSFSSQLTAFINSTRDTYNLTDTRSSYLRGFSSLDDMDSYARSSSYPNDGYLEAGIGFRFVEETQDFRTYGFGWTIRQNQTGGGSLSEGFERQILNTVFTEERNDLTVEFDDSSVFSLWSHGFLALENYIGTWALGYVGGSSTLLDLDLIPFPTPDYTNDNFAIFVADVIPLFFALGYIWPVTRMIKAFVEEKELRIKEGMKIVGLYPSAHFLSWFMCYGIIAFIYSLIIVLVSRTVYPFSDAGIVFWLFFLYGLVIIAFCWLVSSLFNKASVGSTIGALIFLGAFFGIFAIPSQSASNSTKMAACLSAPICFGFGQQVLVEFEAASTGVTSQNLGTPTSNISMGNVIGMLIVDFILYVLLALYFERVIPSKWGTDTLPPWFLFTSNWWCASPRAYEPKARNFGDFYEPARPNDKVGISVLDLKKRFPNQTEEEAAVKGLNVDMYEGQIFALLGHNGAGKTTSINILTGMILPTSGDALVFGQSVLRDMVHIRTQLGMCPQHNILWDYLTVEEHLLCYGRIKGVRPLSALKEQVSKLIEEVGLTEKRRELSKGLSGGMKRKLSVAIALMGGSRVVFMDEPTSGMDPYSRRSTWDMLKKAKESRVVILTTHFMDEADYLGDRIGIMHSGEIVACGSSLFLKNRYGVGYSLRITKQEGVDSKAIRERVLKFIPDARLLTNVAGEVSYQLPKQNSGKFADLFDSIDSDLKSLGIEAYGISVTTMEEVFLRVGQGYGKEDNQEHKDMEKKLLNPTMKEKKSLSAVMEDDDMQIINVEKDPSVPMTRVLMALWGKRWHTSKRTPSIWLWQLVYPTLLIVAGIGLLKLGLDNFRKTVDLSPRTFNSPNRVPIGQNVSSNLFYLNEDSMFLVNATTPSGESLTQTENCDFSGTGLVDSARAMSRYLLCTWNIYQESRYGAYTYADNSGSVTSMFYNTTAAYSSAIYLNQLSIGRVREQIGSNTFRIDGTLSAWPRTKEQEALSTTFVALIAAIGYAFMPAGVARTIVQEREINSKHLQIISGVPLLLYWIANFVWDYISMLPSGLLSVAWFSAYEIPNLDGEAGGAIVVAVLLYSAAVIAFTYCLSFLFKNETVAQNICLLAYILLGGLLLVAAIVLDFIASTRDVNKRLKYLYRFFPSFCLGEVIINLLTRDSVAIYGSRKEVWDMDIVGIPMLYLFFEIWGYAFVLFTIEYVLSSPSLYSWIFQQDKAVDSPPDNQDSDVAAEKERLMKGGEEGTGDVVEVRGLRKMYSNGKVAVKDMWFGISKGQCFGFLGINGAGKTTTLKMITGDVLPTVGTAKLAGFDILQNQREVRKHIGYCPQFDALLPMMTGRETLSMFAMFKGVKLDKIDEYVDRMLKRLTLTPYADKPCGGYSGGNKRKLSVGIALIGGPPIVFLDEPSTGMDPVSRRFMWDLISSTMASRSVILTTHSMEECEALCSRLGIMVSGRLRCLGSIPHLKQKYAKGYQLNLKIESKSLGGFHSWLKKTFPDAKVLEDQGQNKTYQVAQDGKTSLGNMFRTLETQRKAQGIIEYSVSETTLEQIFIHFARQQEEEKGPVKGFYVEDVKDTKHSGFQKLRDDIVTPAAKKSEEEKDIKNPDDPAAISLKVLPDRIDNGIPSDSKLTTL